MTVEWLQVQGPGNDAIIAALTAAGALLKREQYPHKYPYDWRTKKPTIFRATDQVPLTSIWMYSCSAAALPLPSHIHVHNSLTTAARLGLYTQLTRAM